MIISSEQVSVGHPDKICDQISDAILTECLKLDKSSRVAVETLIKDNQVVVAGEISTKHYFNLENLVRQVVEPLGLKNVQVTNLLGLQSSDIAKGVDNGGAGDQGMMFGYATNETENYMPLALDLSHRLLKELAHIRKYEKDLLPYLRPDAKSQVTIEYDNDNKPVRIDTIVISTQHDDFANEEAMRDKITNDLVSILIPRVKAQLPVHLRDLFTDSITYHINPTGKFVIGGPHGDTGLTGRKIIVDTYGGKGAHGGGAFSGKDPSKVDRSAAYAARHIAKNLVAAGVADEVLVQVSYAIGVAAPVSLLVNTFGTQKVELSEGEISTKVSEIFDMKPFAIEQRLKLRNPIYKETASYGHLGREPKTVSKRFESANGQDVVEVEVELFTWEKLDFVDQIKTAFGS